MDAGLLRTIARTAQKTGIRTTSLQSMAGHDAAVMAKSCRSALIFVPCKAGISHSPHESISISHVVPGMHLLLESIKAIHASGTR